MDTENFPCNEMGRSHFVDSPAILYIVLAFLYRCFTHYKVKEINRVDWEWLKLRKRNCQEDQGVPIKWLSRQHPQSKNLNLTQSSQSKPITTPPLNKMERLDYSLSLRRVSLHFDLEFDWQFIYSGNSFVQFYILNKSR